jgi:MFS family permease
MSDQTIQRWTRWLTRPLLVASAIGIIITVVGLVQRDDTVMAFGAGFVAFGIFVALVIGAFLGGQTLARFGGLVGLALVAGIVLGLAGGLIAWWVTWLGVAIFVLAVIGFFIMGIRRRVPMWIGGVTVGRGDSNGERAGQRRQRG